MNSSFSEFEKKSDEITATGGHRILSPVDVFTSLMIFGLESKCDQYKNQDHRKGDPDFCVVTVGLEPTVRKLYSRDCPQGSSLLKV